MNAMIKKPILFTVVMGLVMQLAACGTILHPERKGQQAGRIDPGVAALDAIGLLFFFVPGVIAFAVDFSNGTIYLPGGSAATDSADMNVVTVEGDLNREKIEQVILGETGKAVELSQSEIHPGHKALPLSELQSEVRFL